MKNIDLRKILGFGEWCWEDYEEICEMTDRLSINTLGEEQASLHWKRYKIVPMQKR